MLGTAHVLLTQGMPDRVARAGAAETALEMLPPDAEALREMLQGAAGRGRRGPASPGPGDQVVDAAETGSSPIATAAPRTGRGA